ncbi:hypothetical protein [Streptomyces sp. NPDC006012]|uniref:hypothetical protein n=1 Tax=Streptomyces sp. NPDC006012 TaxID=3364739 RepID=UPI0036853E89
MEDQVGFGAGEGLVADLVQDEHGGPQVAAGFTGQVPCGFGGTPAYRTPEATDRWLTLVLPGLTTRGRPDTTT